MQFPADFKPTAVCKMSSCVSTPRGLTTMFALQSGGRNENTTAKKF